MTGYKPPASRGKADSNQAEIVKGLREMGHTVEPLSAVGKGVPDLLVGVRSKPFNVNILMEVKTGTCKMRENQVSWHRRWQGQCCVVRSLEDAVKVIQAIAG